jgi:hypothetical protein
VKPGCRNSNNRGLAERQLLLDSVTSPEYQNTEMAA